MEIVFRHPVAGDRGVSRTGPSFLGHPLFAWLGLRPVHAQHTEEEGHALQRWASGRRSLVEIGVAEGASALALRKVMHTGGVLYLIDPFHLSRIPLVNSVRRVARQTVNRSSNGQVEWVEQFSCLAAKTWRVSIDFLFLDGDHSYQAVQQDWLDWSPFLPAQGIVAFHDARTFHGGWTSSDDGPVMFVDRGFRNGRLTGWEIIEEVHSMVIVRRSA